ncbi:MAG: restriction endonuclease subunit S [Sulfuritalea sp.]|nr:restriction endonuclease subunit S [Sulfuritalea sp.]
MGEISDVVGGGTPKTNDPSNFEGGDIPWITPADLSGYTAKYISRGNRFITRKGLESSAARLLPASTVLFTSRAPIGYVAIAGNPIATNQGFKSFVLKSGVLPEYVYWWLKGSKHLAEKLANGTTFLELSGASAKKIPIPIVPLERQRAVVAEIEKQFSRLDEAVAGLKRVKANLKRYKAAILKAAVEGRLVSTEADLARREGRSFETGAQLLQRILETRRRQWQGKGKYKEPTRPNTTDLPDLPEGWSWVSFGALGNDPFNTVQTGPFGAQLHNTEFTASGVPVIAVGNLTGTGFRTKGLYFVSQEKALQLARYDVWAGDLLFARSGATLGKVCVAPAEVHDWRMTGHILRARLNRGYIIPDVAVYSLAALPAVTRQIFGNVRGVTRPGFNTSLLESIQIPVPPLAEQHRIVAEVDRLLSIAREAEAEVETNLKRAQALRQAVLSKSFQSASV